jgi:hypothetical protein
MKLRITRKQAYILDCIFTVVYLSLAFWADWRIGLAFICYEISCVLGEFHKFTGKGPEVNNER